MNAALFDAAVVAGDLKSPNVLVDAKFRAKVADFGLSQKKHLGISTRRGEDGPSGTPFWMAPELLAGRSPLHASFRHFIADAVTFCKGAFAMRHWEVPGSPRCCYV